MSNRIARWVTGAGLAVSVLRIAQVYERLPEGVGSHFGADGTPDVVTSKSAFVVTFFLIWALVVGSLLGSVALIGRLPDKYLNLPRKEYWMSEGRIDEAKTKLRTAMWWLSAATTVLCAVVLELVLRANLQRSPLHLAVLWAALGAYIASTMAWIVALFGALSPRR